MKLYKYSFHLLLIITIIFSFFFLTLPSANALTQCDAEQGACAPLGTAKLDCNYYASLDNYGNPYQCGSGNVCCDATGNQPTCNTGCDNTGQNCTTYDNTPSIVCTPSGGDSCTPNGGQCLYIPNPGSPSCSQVYGSAWYINNNYNCNKPLQFCCMNSAGGGGSGGNWMDGRTASACQSVTGWACATGGGTVKVDLYDGPYNGSLNNFVGEVTADSYTPDNPAPYCNSYQGFVFPASSLIYDGKQHTYYAYINGNATTINNSPQGSTCGYSIGGQAYIDYNHDGLKNGGDTSYVGTVETTTGKTDATDGSGNYQIINLAAGTYTIEISLPVGGWKSITTPKVTVGPNKIGQNVSMTPLYSIAGTVFMDNLNKNGVFDATESAYTGGGSVTISGGPTSAGPFTVQANGTYTTGQVLQAGTYTVTYATALPTGYKNTTPLSWSVTVGNPASAQAGYMCDKGASLNASCGNPQSGSISGLDFGLTNLLDWTQLICADGRFGSGYSQNIPSTANCGGTSSPYAIENNAACTLNPGILFSGSTDPNYGNGSGASTSNMVVGNGLFPENFTPRIPNTVSSSYSFVTTTLNNASPAPTPLTSICPSLTNCVLSETTPGGVYTTTAADGPVTLSVSNTDGTSQLGQANYTFVIGGNLTLASKIAVQNGYSASFISGGDIHVASTVGESDWTSLSPDLEGFFSADGNFSIDAAYASGQQCTASGQPKELKLNIVGSVIANAANKGGSFVNNREGCLQDLQCPATTVTANPLLILHAPGALKPPYSFWQELNP